MKSLNKDTVYVVTIDGEPSCGAMFGAGLCVLSASELWPAWWGQAAGGPGHMAIISIH